MTLRERKMAYALMGLLAVGGGGALGYTFVYQPLQGKKAQARGLQEEIGGTAGKEGLQSRVSRLVKDRALAAEARRQSLPPDVGLAKLEYGRFLRRLLEDADVAGASVSDGRPLPHTPPVTAELAPKKPAYTRYQFQIDFEKATILQVADFLREFYQANLLHRVTELTVSRENKADGPRNGLKVKMAVEAIVLDGAQERAGLFPYQPPAAAVGGLAVAYAIAQEAAGRTAATATPLPRGRNYTVLAFNDPFYGPLPPDKPPVPLSVGKIADVVMKLGEKTPEVKVKLTGDTAAASKVTATVAGDLLPAGDLKVDPKTHAFALPAPKADADYYSAVATVSVVATSADGKEKARGTFKVTLAEPPPVKVDPKDDIAAAIRLVGLPTSTDEGITTVKALIKDAANPFRYDVIATAKGIEVVKWWPLTGKTWKKDYGYDHPAGVLAFSDDNSATRRTFKVIAVEADGLVIAEVPNKPDPKAETRKGPGGPRRQGPADPFALVAGNAAAVTKPPPEVYYRWGVGKTLKDVVEKKENRIPPEEAKKILQRAAADGPLTAFATAALSPEN